MCIFFHFLFLIQFSVYLFIVSVLCLSVHKETTNVLRNFLEFFWKRRKKWKWWNGIFKWKPEKNSLKRMERTNKKPCSSISINWLHITERKRKKFKSEHKKSFMYHVSICWIGIFFINNRNSLKCQRKKFGHSSIHVIKYLSINLSDWTDRIFMYLSKWIENQTKVLNVVIKFLSLQSWMLWLIVF